MTYRGTTEMIFKSHTFQTNTEEKKMKRIFLKVNEKKKVENVGQI